MTFLKFPQPPFPKFSPFFHRDWETHVCQKFHHKILNVVVRKSSINTSVYKSFENSPDLFFQVLTKQETFLEI